MTPVRFRARPLPVSVTAASEALNLWVGVRISRRERVANLLERVPGCNPEVVETTRFESSATHADQDMVSNVAPTHEDWVRFLGSVRGCSPTTAEASGSDPEGCGFESHLPYAALAQLGRGNRFKPGTVSVRIRRAVHYHGTVWYTRTAGRTSVHPGLISPWVWGATPPSATGSRRRSGDVTGPANRRGGFDSPRVHGLLV